MMKNTKKAFTLVELIVVITILAILGTIAFISLQGYSAEARDSKRVNDITSLSSKVNIEVVKGVTLSDLITTGTVPNYFDGTSPTIVAGTGGVINFTNLKEKEADFKDPKGNNYPMVINVGGSGTGAYSYFQLATKKEADNIVERRGYVGGSGDLIN